jgi:kinesin family protein 4/21/27
MCKPLIASVFEGYNATFFAYGQTGSGKTFTMGEEGGIIPSAVQAIFRRRQQLLSVPVNVPAVSVSVSVEMSFIEIYMEECVDLLAPFPPCPPFPPFPPSGSELVIRERESGETVLEGARSLAVSDWGEVQKLLGLANSQRATAKTAMNKASSRSHAICTLTVRITDTGTGTGTVTVGKLHLVDLAGSERAKKTLATGEQLQE